MNTLHEGLFGAIRSGRTETKWNQIHSEMKSNCTINNSGTSTLFRNQRKARTTRLLGTTASFRNHHKTRMRFWDHVISQSSHQLLAAAVPVGQMHQGGGLVPTAATFRNDRWRGKSFGTAAWFRNTEEGGKGFWHSCTISQISWKGWIIFYLSFKAWQFLMTSGKPRGFGDFPTFNLWDCTDLNHTHISSDPAIDQVLDDHTSPV